MRTGIDSAARILAFAALFLSLIGSAGTVAIVAQQNSNNEARIKDTQKAIVSLCTLDKNLVNLIGVTIPFLGTTPQDIVLKNDFNTIIINLQSIQPCSRNSH